MSNNWKNSGWSDADGNEWWISKTRDHEGEYVRAVLINQHTGNPIKFEDWDISEWVE